jgi:hypothetical protein
MRAMKAGKRIVDPVALAAVQQAFAEQASDELIRRASRYARQRAAIVRRAGRRIDNLYGRELVQDALCDIWSGAVTWDPARSSLLDEVRSVVRSRSWKDAKWARRSPHLRARGRGYPARLRSLYVRHHGTAGVWRRANHLSWRSR